MREPDHDPTGLDRRTFLQAGAAGAAIAALAGIRRAAASERVDFGNRAGDPEAFLREYDLAPGVTYFNHASIGTIPRKVQDAHLNYLRVCETNPWLYMWGGAWARALASTRSSVARFLGAKPAEIAIQHNTTEGFNMLALGLPLGSGDEVVFSSLNHDGASRCFEYHAGARGYRVRTFDFPLEERGLSADDIVRLHTDAISERTKLLVLPEIDNMIGLRHPVGAIVRAARAKGVKWIAVDGAQAVAMRAVDVRATDVDVYCTSPHKWLQAPKGLGVAYVHPRVQEVLRPMWVTWGQKRWKDARRFEDYGTRNLPAALALGDAARFQSAIGTDVKERELSRLRTTFFERVEATPKLVWRSPEPWSLGASLYAIQVVGKPSPEVAKRLFKDYGIVVRPFGQKRLNTLRVSPHLTCTPAQIDRFFSAVEACLA